jgi:hypothetical protein
LEVACHSHAEAVLKVDFPRGVKRIGYPFVTTQPWLRVVDRQAKEVKVEEQR